MNIDTFYDIFRYTKMTASPDQAVVDVATDTIVEQQQQQQTQEQHLGLTIGEQTQESATAESASPVKTEKKTCSGSSSKSDVKHDNGREKGDSRREKGDSGKRLEFSKRESRSLDAQSKKYEHKNSKTRRGPLLKSKSEESRNDNGLRRQGSRESDTQPRRSSGNKKLVRSKAFDKDTYEISNQVSDVPPRLKMKADSSDYPSPRIVRQHSGTRSEPALSRDSSMDDQSHRPIDSTGTDVLQFIIKALQTQKDRKHLLDFEHDVLEFLDSGEEEKKFPPMNSYQRMLLHRVAVLFGLEHNVDDTKSYVILNKTQHMRRPDQKFQDYIKDDPVPTTILKRSGEQTADYSSMGRPFDKDLNKQNKSFEERKENYEELRHKLFSGDKEPQEVPTIQRPNRLLVNSNRRQDSGTSDESMRSYFEDRPWSSVESSGSERQHPTHIIKASSFAGVTNRNSFNRKDSSSSWSSSGSSNRGSLSKLARVDSSEQRTGSPQYRPSPQFPVFSQPFISQPGHQITYQPVQPMAQVSSWQHSNITGHSQQQMPANSGMITPGNISSPTILYSAPSIESVPAGSILYNPHTGSPYQNQDGTPLVYHPGMSSQVTANQPITNQNLQQVQLHQQIVNQGQMQQSLQTAAPMNINQLQNQQHLNQQITAPSQHIPSQVYGTQPVLLHQLPHQTSGEYPDVTVQLQTMNINRQPSNESDPNQQQQQQQQQVMHQQQMVGQVVRHPGVMSGFQVQGTGTPGGAPTQQQQPPQVLFCPPNQNQPQVTQTQITYQVPAQFVQQQQGLTMQPLTPAQLSSQHQQQQQQQQTHQTTTPVIYQTQPQLLGQQQQPLPTQGGYQHIPISNLHHQQQQQQQQQQILYQPVYDPQASHPQGFGSNLQIVYQTTPNTTQLQTHNVQDIHRSTSPGSQILAAPIVSQVQAQTPMAYVHMHQQHRPQSPHSGSQYSSHSVQGSKSPSPQQAVLQYQQRITPGSDIRSPRPALYMEQHSTLSPSMSPAQSPSPSRADSLEKGVTGRQRHSATLHSEQGSQEDPSQDDLNVLYVVGIPVDATVMEAESMLHEVVNLGAQITWTKRNSGLPGIADRNDKATEYTIRALLPTAEHAQRVHRSISSTNYQLLLHKTDSANL
ncbi:cAMP-regulated phosphoprotein 21-like isoform X2 [Anneissia japonica]|uniref:cAMP-regulated phosphoprotein 21-like isoform X2 n=1 Tax=Anneissia japonica TaxID=1529436 RepID=UPI001425804C|nr:cAMP-regulated phosphoprotein 21-like isoform X2 [Anneissia japonica]